MQQLKHITVSLPENIASYLAAQKSDGITTEDYIAALIQKDMARHAAKNITDG
jgi:hypothetical protein